MMLIVPRFVDNTAQLASREEMRFAEDVRCKDPGLTWNA